MRVKPPSCPSRWAASGTGITASGALYRARKLGMSGQEERLLALKTLLHHVEAVWQRPEMDGSRG